MRLIFCMALWNSILFYGHIKVIYSVKYSFLIPEMKKTSHFRRHPYKFWSHPSCCKNMFVINSLVIFLQDLWPAPKLHVWFRSVGLVKWVVGKWVYLPRGRVTIGMVCYQQYLCLIYKKKGWLGPFSLIPGTILW